MICKIRSIFPRNIITYPYFTSTGSYDGSQKGESIRIICPGKVFRRDNDDATHSHQFMQIEGLVIGENIRMSDLKGTLDTLAKKCLVQTAKFDYVRASSHLLSHQ